ncbi:MAG: hypothetical protein HRF43_04870 [Phycisphaerae bacterium]|jgi:hypothetical protein
MALYEGGGQLSKALRHLLNCWEETRIGWDDAQSRAFEESFLFPLQQDLRSATRAMAHMAALLDKLRRECG